MKIRAVVEFELKFDEDLPSIDELIEYHGKWNLIENPNIFNSLEYEIKNLLEDEFRGMAESETSSVKIESIVTQNNP